MTIPGPIFPLEFEVDFSDGSGEIVADLNLYYCETEAESLCLFDQVRLRLPLVVGDAEGSTAELTYDIPTPLLPGS